jgi:hypothetical protein
MLIAQMLSVEAEERMKMINPSEELYLHTSAPPPI